MSLSFIQEDFTVEFVYRRVHEPVPPENSTTRNPFFTVLTESDGLLIQKSKSLPRPHLRRRTFTHPVIHLLSLSIVNFLFYLVRKHRRRRDTLPGDQVYLSTHLFPEIKE